jgi:mono/diheme cytochrome c family protein
MKSALFSFVLAAVLVCVGVSRVSGQNSNNQNEPQKNKNTDVYAELGKAPEKARNRVNPLENDPDAVAAGRLLFEDHCAECHGATAAGGKKAPSLRVPEVQNAAPGTLFWLVTNGVVRKGMPVWSRLPEPQRWQLVRYLKSLGVAAAPAAEAAPKPRVRSGGLFNPREIPRSAR